MKLEITGLNHQGQGIGRINNKVVFVDNAMIGEIVEIVIVKEYKKYMLGRVIEYIKKSIDRVDPKCIYYDKCGGCNICNLSYDKQLEFKRNKVIDIFSKYLGVNINPNIVSCEIKNYRNKIVLHVSNGVIGYYEKNSNNIVEIDKCLIANDKINNIIKLIKDKINISNVSKILIRATNEDSMVVFYGNIDVDNINYLDDIDSLYINDKLIRGKSKIVEKLGDYSFYISKDSFFQVNTKQAVNLYNKVLEFANLDKDDSVLDLYCGTGTIGIYLARFCRRVLGIEINSSCIDDARENSKLNKINNISFICNSSSIIRDIDFKADVVIVDPPRSGLDNVTIDTLNSIDVKRIVYVSCDPMTLVRDIKKLSNYEFKDIELFDMFAGDYHVESVVLLERR